MSKKRRSPASRRVRKTKQPAVRRRATSPVVTIRARGSGGRIITATIRPKASLGRLAEEWTYILRARSRWVDNDDLRDSIRLRALDDLDGVGVPRSFMRMLASATHAEVELHEWDRRDARANALHEAAAEVPWEYLLSAGTRKEGRHNPLLITRLFRNGRAPSAAAPPRRVLFVESAP